MSTTSTSENASSMKDKEPLLNCDKERFVLFPIEHNDIWDFYRRAVANFWVPEEVNFADDLVDWNEKLSDDERPFY